MGVAPKFKSDRAVNSIPPSVSRWARPAQRLLFLHVALLVSGLMVVTTYY